MAFLALGALRPAPLVLGLVLIVLLGVPWGLAVTRRLASAGQVPPPRGRPATKPCGTLRVSSLVNGPALASIFVAVAEERHFGRAAARLHMTQRPLSRAIRQLEADVGALLLHRSPAGVTLTPAGTALYDEARALLGPGVARPGPGSPRPRGRPPSPSALSPTAPGRQRRSRRRLSRA